MKLCKLGTRSILAVAALLAGSLVLSACVVQKIPIQQGNALPPAKLAKLSTGMTAKQVRFLLGAPVARDPFQPHRWVYVYYHSHGGRIERRHVTVYFRDGKVSRIQRGSGTG